MRLPVVMVTAASVADHVNEVKPPGVEPWTKLLRPSAVSPPSATVRSV